MIALYMVLLIVDALYAHLFQGCCLCERDAFEV